MSEENAQSPRKGEAIVPGIEAAIEEILRRNTPCPDPIEQALQADFERSKQAVTPAPKDIGAVIQFVEEWFDAASTQYAGPTPEAPFVVEDEPHECPQCEGSGEVDCRPGNSGDHEVANDEGKVQCPLCEGEGSIEKS